MMMTMYTMLTAFTYIPTDELTLLPHLQYNS